jgi:hypothetical protein
LSQGTNAAVRTSVLQANLFRSLNGRMCAPGDALQLTQRITFDVNHTSARALCS